MASSEIRFAGSQGDELSARLDLPVGQPHAWALFAHCFTCSKQVHAATRIASGLTRHGIGVLRFDFTGLGGSGGDFANTTFSSNTADVVAAATWLRTKHPGPLMLIGHSLGGSAVISAAAHIEAAMAVVTVNAPFDPAHVTSLFADAVDDIEAQGEVEVDIAGRKFSIRKEFLRDANAQNMTQTLHDLKRPLLVFHGPQDQTVGVDNARQIYEAARHPKSFVSLDTADHLLSDPADAAYVADVLSAWVQRFLPASDGTGVERGTVVVSGSQRGRLAQNVEAGPHTLSADEPPGVGDDTGPTPYDLVLAGLGACTAMTLRMYADQKKWKLDDVSVTLHHTREHAADASDCEKPTAKIDVITRTLTITGDLDDAQRQRLLEIAERCPVHRTLMAADKQIVTTLA